MLFDLFQTQCPLSWRLELPISGPPIKHRENQREAKRKRRAAPFSLRIPKTCESLISGLTLITTNASVWAGDGPPDHPPSPSPPGPAFQSIKTTNQPNHSTCKTTTHPSRRKAAHFLRPSLPPRKHPIPCMLQLLCLLLLSPPVCMSPYLSTIFPQHPDPSFPTPCDLAPPPSHTFLIHSPPEVPSILHLFISSNSSQLDESLHSKEKHQWCPPCGLYISSHYQPQPPLPLGTFSCSLPCSPSPNESHTQPRGPRRSPPS